MNLSELSKFIRIGKLEIFLCLVFLFLLLFPFPTGGDRFFWKYFFDAGHPILFFLCTLLIYRIYIPSPKNSKRRTIVEAATISFLFSASIEIIQPIMWRSASLRDLSLGALGIISASFFLSSYPILKVLGFIFLFFVQSIAFKPVTEAMHAIKWRKEHFPLLADFEDLTQLNLIKGTYYLQKSKGSTYLKTYQPLGADSLIRYEAGDKNWTNYKNFNFEIFNPLKENSIIRLRIDDNLDSKEIGTRFVKKIDLMPGWNKISISTTEIENSVKLRKLNLKNIRYIYFYLEAEENHHWFGIDNLSLS